MPDPALRTDVVAMLERSVGGSIPIGGSLLVLPLLCDDAELVIGSGHSRSIGQRLIDPQGFAVPGLGRVEVAAVLVFVGRGAFLRNRDGCHAA